MIIRKLALLSLISLMLFLIVSLQAQDEELFIFEGDALAVKINYSYELYEGDEIFIAEKEADGSWHWMDYSIYSISEAESSEACFEGYMYYCINSAKKEYCVDFCYDSDILFVYELLEDGSYGNEWELYRNYSDPLVIEETSSQNNTETTGTNPELIYFVYDGEDFSILLTCYKADNTVQEVEFSSQDANGEWTWKSFEKYDFRDFNNDTGSGFTYYCKDGNNNRYAVTYFNTSDSITVTFLNPDGTSGRQWNLSRRQ